MHQVGFHLLEMWGLKLVHFIPNFLVFHSLLVVEGREIFADATCTNPSQCARSKPLNAYNFFPTPSAEANFTEMYLKEK